MWPPTFEQLYELIVCQNKTYKQVAQLFNVDVIAVRNKARVLCVSKKQPNPELYKQQQVKARKLIKLRQDNIDKNLLINYASQVYYLKDLTVIRWDNITNSLQINQAHCLADQVESALDSLSDRLLDIFIERWIKPDGIGLYQSKLGEKYGVTKQRIYQLEFNALRDFCRAFNDV